MDSALDARNVVKAFKIKESSGSPWKDFFLPQHQSFRALDDVSLKIGENETVGLLGPNGAGKTTLTKCLCGLVTPNEGEILIGGRPVSECAEKIGVVFGYHLVYHRMTGYDNLKFFGKIYHVKNWKQRIKELSEFFGLGDWIHNYVENYSLGMKAKISLARALIHDPEILLLDEPTLGLDPQISASLREEIKAMDKSILLTTHYMEEAQELCDRIAIINKGKIAVTDTPGKLKDLVEKNKVVEVVVDGFNGKLVGELKQQDYVHGVSFKKDKIRIIIEKKEDMPALLLVLSKHRVVKIQELEPDLEYVFLKFVRE